MKQQQQSQLVVVSRLPEGKSRVAEKAPQKEERVGGGAEESPRKETIRHHSDQKV